jgi:phospholipase C
MARVNETRRPVVVVAAVALAGTALVGAGGQAGRAEVATTTPIKHVVVLMQENRSFDHYLGHLALFDPSIDTAVEPTEGNPDPLDSAGAKIKPFHQPDYCEVADLAHSWNGTHHEWDGGEMDGFTAANVNPADPSGSRTMGFYTAGRPALLLLAL